MQMVKKIAIGLFFIWFALILFMPKEEMYFKIEQELVKNEIELNEESRSEGLFSLMLKNVTVYVKGVSLVTIEEIDFFTLLFYTNVGLKNLIFDESLKSMIPTEIETLSVSQNILSPVDLNVAAEGIFGEVIGTVNLVNRNLHLDINDTKELEMLKSQLKQGEKGWYYETSF